MNTMDAPQAPAAAPLLPGQHVVIIGAGPAGLTAAYLLSKAGVRTPFSKPTTSSAGISRTAQYKGFRFDIGGHRFFTKIEPVAGAVGRDPRRRVHLGAAAVAHLLQRQVLRLPAQSRQRAQGSRPDQRAADRARAISSGTTGPTRSKRTSSSGSRTGSASGCTRSSSRPTPKKCGAFPCTEIRAEWAAQRIQGLSLAQGDPHRPRRSTSARPTIKIADHEFQYPRLGPGQMWETLPRPHRASWATRCSSATT